MDDAYRDGADWMAALLSEGEASPAMFKAALTSVPAADRDAWLDRALGIEEVPDHGGDLPRGCVPYVPCRVDALIRALELAEVRASDVFVDVGSGVGRTA